MKANVIPLEPGRFYHIYNRSINGESLFLKDKHYHKFLDKYQQHVAPFMNTYAYCLLGNHFHFLVGVKKEDELIAAAKEKYPTKDVQGWSTFLSKQFAHLFNGYAQYFNIQTDRTGGLFETPFRRILVDHDAYFSRIISYIHQNPQHHGLASDFKDYPFSSYWSLLSEKPTKLLRKDVMNWFGDQKQFIDFHEQPANIKDINKVILEFD